MRRLVKSLALIAVATAVALLTLSSAVPPRTAQAETSKARPQAVQKQPVQKRRLRPAKAPPLPKAGPVAKPERAEFSEAEQARATVLGLPDARIWGDSEADFARVLPTVNGPWIAISGGGAGGAYAAGLVVGLTEIGKRPEFSAVTGASIGALIAPYVFLGPKYDSQLRNQFTTITAGDIFEDITTPQSLFDSWPLKRTIEKNVTKELLADIAAEHRRGRRLLAVTTNLDAGRRVVWNMGAIAAQGDEKAAKLFRDVLLASASIPGLFPPVAIDAEVDGKQIQELHNDGTITAPFFVAPESVLAGTGSLRLPTHELYVVANTKFRPEFEFMQPRTAILLGRSIGVALQAAIQVEVLLTRVAAQRLGIDLHVAHVDDDFDHPARGAFDPAYMKALFEFALERTRKGNAFERGPPELRGRQSDVAR
jgi:hypothetical protein